MKELQDIIDAVVGGDIAATKEAVGSALDKDIAALEVINKGMVAGLDVVGERFAAGEMFLPEMMLSAVAVRESMPIATEGMDRDQLKAKAKVVIGSVKGDLHDIGKNLVAMMLEGAGFEVLDLGVDVSAEAFVQAAGEGAQVIGLSALLTTTMSSMEGVVKALQASEVREGVKVIVGGAPVTEEYARKIGADAYAPDASSAARAVRQLLA